MDVPAVHRRQSSQIKAIPHQRVDMKSAAMCSDFVKAKPKDRLPIRFLLFSNEEPEQPMRPERSDFVLERERQEPVPRKLRQELPPRHCQLTTHREDPLLPFKKRH